MTEKKKEIAPVNIEESVEEAAPSGADVPAVQTLMQVGEVSGEVDASDIIIPTVKIIQNMTANNPDKLDNGTITIDGTMLIGGDKNTARLTIISIRKYFKEVIKFGGTGVNGEFPMQFESAKAARDAGFTVIVDAFTRNAEGPKVDSAAVALVAFEPPDGASDRAFPYEIDGVKLALARWYIEKSAYRNVAKVIFSRQGIELKKRGILSGVWRLTTSLVRGKEGEYAVPSIALLTDERSDEFITGAVKQFQPFL
jgi:galactitol-specific phosphotransferase system IIB component